VLLGGALRNPENMMLWARMMSWGRVTRHHPVLRVAAGEMSRRSDTLAVEEPLEVRLNGEPYLVTMRTPGNDIDLVRGLLYSERIITERADIMLARYCAGSDADGVNSYNVLDVTLAAEATVPAAVRRNVMTTSACGICGTTSIDQVLRGAPYESDHEVRVAAELVLSAPVRLRQQQRAFDRTGGLHAAGLLGLDSEMRCVREDVGRHNAVDKVIGWAIERQLLPLRHMILAVSGRASFELTQKAVLAGIPVLAAVSAPSSLAAELAEEAGLTLVGFVRGETMNVYTHAERIIWSANGQIRLHS
jgi:FdhD protein